MEAGHRGAYKFVRPRLVDAFGHMPLGSIRPRHVSAYVAATELGASTISRDLALRHAIFDSAVREELIDSNPALWVERPKQPRRRWRLLDPHEVPVVSTAMSDDRARRVSSPSRSPACGAASDRRCVGGT
jgi:site-specific recombinase XerD